MGGVVKFFGSEASEILFCQKKLLGFEKSGFGGQPHSGLGMVAKKCSHSTALNEEEVVCFSGSYLLLMYDVLVEFRFQNTLSHMRRAYQNPVMLTTLYHH